MADRKPRRGEIWESKATKRRVLVLNDDTEECVDYYTDELKVQWTGREKFVQGAEPVDEYDLDPIVIALNKNHKN